MFSTAEATEGIKGDSSCCCVAAPVEPADLVTEPEPPRGVWPRVKRFLGGDRIDRKRLAALGMGAVCSYGLISNITYGGGMAVGGTSVYMRWHVYYHTCSVPLLLFWLFEQVAWIAFVRRRGVSPLAAGQWQAFLAFYAGKASIRPTP